MDLKGRINPNTIPTYYFPIQTFLETNDIDLKWKKIRRLFPAKVKKTGREAWSTQDIKIMLGSVINIRNRALLLFLASSGIRIGAIEEIRMGNLIDMPLGCKAVLVYEDSTEEYWTFITPEASEILEKYLAKRKSDGVTIETVRLAIRFHKKSKNWYGKRNALMLDDDEQCTWRKMTDEELEKYNLYWYPEEEFCF